MIERVFIEQGMRKIRLEKYFKKELDRAGFTGMKIEKTPVVTKIVLHVVKPGIAIGKKGKTIRSLTEEVKEKFEIKNPQIEIQEIEVPELNATAMVDKITMLLTRGYSWRSVAFRSTSDIMKAGAQGVELTFKGKLAGKGGRNRKERIAKGYMKKAGNQSELVDYAQGDAYPKAGAIGVKLRIIKPNITFPDKLSMEEVIKKIKGKKEEEEEKKTKEKEEEREKKEKKKKKVKKKEKKESKKEKSKEKSKKKKKEKKSKKEGKEKEKKVKGKGGKEKKKEKSKKKKKEKKGKKEKKKSEKKEKKGEKK